MTFEAYAQQYYGVLLKVDKQLMILAIAKVENKINKGKKLTKSAQAVYLVPELMVLAGMLEKQREDKVSMQEFRAITKIDLEEMAWLIKGGSMARDGGLQVAGPQDEVREVQPVSRLRN